jgi:hypothetical protein
VPGDTFPATSEWLLKEVAPLPSSHPVGMGVKRARFLNGVSAIPRLDQGQEPKVAGD